MVGIAPLAKEAHTVTTESPRPLEPGDQAPSFTLSAAHGEGTVSLTDYRGRNPLLVTLFRGLY